VKNHFIKTPNFQELSILEQNEIISKNLKSFLKLRNENETKSFIKSHGKKQALLPCNWLLSKEEVILDRYYLTKNQKSNKLDNILDSLSTNLFVLVDNRREVFTSIDKLPMLATGIPFFTYLNILNHPNEISLQVNWKTNEYSDRDYLNIDISEEIQYPSKIRRKFALHEHVIDFSTGTVLLDQSKIYFF
jgi:glutaredoxin-related protein